MVILSNFPVRQLVPITRTQLWRLVCESRRRPPQTHLLLLSSVSLLPVLERRIDRLIRRGDLQIEFSVIRLTDPAWTRIAPWANEYECRVAASADDRTLLTIVQDWRNRRKDRQVEMIESSACLSPEDRRRLLTELAKVAGKEIRGLIEKTLS